MPGGDPLPAAAHEEFSECGGRYVAGGAFRLTVTLTESAGLPGDDGEPKSAGSLTGIDGLPSQPKDLARMLEEGRRSALAKRPL